MDAEERLRKLEIQNQNLVRRVAALEQNAGWQKVPAEAPVQSLETPAAELTPVAAPKRDLESQIGTRWVAFAGGGVLLLGVIFMMKYAFDQGWIGPLARIFLGVSAGLAIWVAGMVLRDRVAKPYGDVLSATGAALMFVTTLLAFTLPDYQLLTGISDTVGNFLLAIVVVLLAGHAVWKNAPVLVGTALGFAHGVAFTALGEAILIPYVIVLVACLAAAAWRNWWWVTLASVTLLPQWAWIAGDMNVYGYLVLLALHVLTMSVMLWRSTSKIAKIGGPPAIWGFALIPALIGANNLDRALTINFNDGGWTILAFAVIAGLLATCRETRFGQGITAAFFAVIWPLVQLGETYLAWIGLVWGLQLLALTFTTIRHSAWVRMGLAGLLALLALLMMSEPAHFHNNLELVGWWLSLTAALAAAGVAWYRDRPGIASYFSLGCAAIIALAWPAIMREDPLVSLTWAILAAVFIGAGALLRFADLRLTGLAIIPILLIRIITIDMADAEPVLRILVFVGVGALLLGIGYAYARIKKRQSVA